MNKKDEKIIKDARKNNIPVFVLTAKDSVAVEAMREYMEVCSFVNCPKDHINGVYERIKEFEDWQHKNERLVSKPD